MRLQIFVFILITAISATRARSSEVDHYSTLNINLRDSTTELNQWFNSSLSKALITLNNKKHACTEKFLMENIISAMDLGAWAAFEYDLDKRPEIDRIPPNFKESIYRDAKLLDAPVLRTGGAMTSVLKVNGVRIGADKLGHFFNQGFFYYTKPDLHPIKKQELNRTSNGIINGPAYNLSKIMEKKRAVLFSDLEERGSMGLSMNGIKSYGDMASGYDGFLFWSNFFGKPGSVVQCQNGKYVQMKQFDWSQWVTKAWDESINCNEYSKDLGQSVTKRIQDLELKFKRKLACPLEPEVCADLTLRYLEVYPYALNKNCRDFSKATLLYNNLKKLGPKNLCQ